MTFSAMLTWISQVIVTWLVFRDLGPQGARFVGRILGVQSNYWIWVWLIGLTIVSLFMDSRIAANTFAAYTGKRPRQDWYSYGQSGAAQACLWCGLTSFAISLLVTPLVLPSVGVPGVRAGSVCGLALVANAILTRFVVRALLRRRYRYPMKVQPRNQAQGAAVR